MLIYIAGGARSGKSRYAVDLAQRLAKRVVFVATCRPTDDDLKDRIRRHRRERPRHWRTIENRLDLWKIYSDVKGRADLVLIDCLTMYVAGRLVNGEPESKIMSRVDKLCKAAAASRLTTIIVSNEVGSGLVPTTEWGRQFRDYLGRANNQVARRADNAYLMVSGLPLVLKGEKHEC
jgi:adenosylcobinamide kinase/adenosylcobinamide-phosphate guanylyltransferase